MDFRSQLSAFKSGGGSNSGGSSNNNNNANQNSNHQAGGGGRGYSNPRGYGSNNQSSGSYYGRGNDGRDSRDNRDGYHHQDSHHHNRDNYHRRDDHKRRRPWGNNDGDRYGGPPQRRRYHSPDRDGLGDLRQFGYIIPKGNPPVVPPKKKKQKAKHIALLAITIDDLPYEHIWKAWIDTLNATTNDECYVSLVCHAKYPERVTSQWLKDRMLLRRPKLGRGNSYLDPEFLSRTPEWGSVEITRAMLDLLQESCKIGQDDQKDARFSSNRFIVRMPGQTVESTVSPTPEETEATPLPVVDQFLFISETCLPVRTAPETFRLLPGPAISWINARHRKDPKTPKNKYEDDQFALISRKIPGQFRWKADQWVLLGRMHATALLSLDRPHFHPRHQLWQHFRNINASDEMYIPTALSILGHLRYTLEGEDTQRARNAPTETSSSKSPPNSPKREQEDKDKPPANPPPPLDMILKKAVTYTDWTEGMRNPACFTRGILDFNKVALLARSQGCLVARKFAPKVNIPGKDSTNEDVTQEKGYITAEEWLEAVQKWEQEDLAKAGAEGKEEENDEEDADEEEEAPAETKDASQDPAPEAAEAASKPHTTPAKKDSDEEGEEEDDDDDQQENELE